MKLFNIDPVKDSILTWWHGKTIDATTEWREYSYIHRIKRESKKAAFFAYVSAKGKASDS